MPRRLPHPPPRSQRPPQERDLRSQAVQRVANQPLLRGSLVRMQRTCGKKNCHCQQGEKHVSLYLAIRSQGRRAMIYVPAALEETVRLWVETGQAVDGLLDAVSEHCLQAFLEKKRENSAEKRKEKPP